MSIELKPCPFCSGKADYYDSGQLPAAVGFPLSVHVLCRECGVEMAVPSKGGEENLRRTERKAAERWNRRTERTCRMRYNPIHSAFACTGCNVEFESATYGVTIDDGRSCESVCFRYCPSCGARVVDADD